MTWLKYSKPTARNGTQIHDIVACITCILVTSNRFPILTVYRQKRGNPKLETSTLKSSINFFTSLHPLEGRGVEG